MNTRAVGVFDSGLGGLTAVRSLRKILKEEFNVIERERISQAMKLVLQTNLLGPALFFACRLVLILPNIPEAELLRKALSIDLLPIVYGLLLDIFLLPFYVRLKN